MRTGNGATAVAAIVAIGIALGGCGGGDDDATTSAATDTTSAAAEENAGDIEVMNVGLTQELTLAQVYRHSLPLLRGEVRTIARQFLSQEEEHINGITKVLRGLEGEAEGEVEEVDYSDVKTEEDALLQLYEITNLQLKHFIDDVAHLESIAPRALAATIAANEAQHLTIWRQLLGSGRAGSVPEAFDGGEVPSPLEIPEPDKG